MVEVGSIWVNEFGRKFKILKILGGKLKVIRLRDRKVFYDTEENLRYFTTLKESPVLDLENE